MVYMDGFNYLSPGDCVYLSMRFLSPTHVRNERGSLKVHVASLPPLSPPLLPRETSSAAGAGHNLPSSRSLKWAPEGGELRGREGVWECCHAAQRTMQISNHTNSRSSR
ncbi:hypothetical protein FKM82_007341 [Ascaphus truei]